MIVIILFDAYSESNVRLGLGPCLHPTTSGLVEDVVV